MGRRSRPYASVEAERQRVLELHLEGWTQAEIAEEIRCDPSSVSRHLSAIEAEWRQQTVDYGTAKGRQLAQIRRMLREAWIAWHASKKVKEQRLDERVVDEAVALETGEAAPVANAKTKTSRRREKQTGNPAYMSTIQWCLEQEARLLGLSASPHWVLEHEAKLVAEQLGEDAAEIQREARRIYEESKHQPGG